jgi:hypothetical protein
MKWTEIRDWAERESFAISIVAQWIIGALLILVVILIMRS